MPLSVSRHPLSQLGATRGERPLYPALADASVHRLLRVGRSANRHVCSLLLPHNQFRHVRRLGEVAAATPVRAIGRWSSFLTTYATTRPSFSSRRWRHIRRISSRCSCHPTARNFNPSRGSGSSPVVCQPTTATSAA